MDFYDDAPHWHVASDADLAELWASLMGEGGFGRRSLWLLFLDRDGMTLPVLIPVEDIPVRPTPFELDGLFRFVDLLREDGVASFAPLLSRPGPPTKTGDDRGWAAGLTRAARQRGVAMWPVHLATYERIQPMAADDLIGA